MVALPLGWGKVRVSEGEPEGPHWVFTSWDGRRMRLEEDGLGAVRPLDVPGGEEAGCGPDRMLSDPPEP